MKTSYIAIILLLATSPIGKGQSSWSPTQFNETAEEEEPGYFFGLPKLIDMADAIVILRIDRNMLSFIGATPYSTHECIVEKTLKGDIPQDSKITLQLHRLNSIESPYPTGTTHLVFLIKTVHDDEPTEYRMLMFDEAQIRLPPWGHSKELDNKTIEEQLKILIKDAIEYHNKMHNEKTTLFKGILDKSEKSIPSWSGDSLNITLSFGDKESKYIRISGPEVALSYEKVSEMFKRIRDADIIDLSLVYQALVGPQTALRAEAATYLGTHGNETSVPYLIDALSDQSMHVGGYISGGPSTTRYRANDSLNKLTGKDFGFVWDDPIDKRSEAIIRWREWYSQKDKGSLTFYKTYKIEVPVDNYIIISMRGMGPGNYLVLDLNTNELRIYSPYENSGLLLKRKLTSFEIDLILSIFESREYYNVPEKNMKTGADAQEIEITSSINKRNKQNRHIIPDNRTLKHIINIYRELNDVPKH